MKVLNNITKIETLLINDKRYRDNDHLLIARLFWDEINHSETMTAKEFLVLLRDRKLSNTESIRRTRQKLQEQNVELRGKSYRSRKKETAKVRKELGYES